MGGDEFTVIQSDVSCAEQVDTVAQKTPRAVAQPYVLKNDELSITASVGIAVYPTDGEDAGTLIRNADTAMYSAKEQGRNRYLSYTRAMGAVVLKKRDEIQIPRAPSQRKASHSLVKV